MPTNAEIITDALRDLNVVSELEDASAEQQNLGIRKLNQMMETWKTDGINIGYFAQSTGTDTCPIPDWAEGGVTNSLSVIMAPNYGASVSPELAASGSQFYNSLLRESIKLEMDNADMSHLPIGSGLLGNQWDIGSDS